MMKDNFSTQADQYAKYRPSYPNALFDFLIKLVPGRQRAWDCGTGNGQVAEKLAKHFEKIDATDISSRQLQNAFQHERITYSVQPAEKTNFPANSFDLVTVAQAVHWFDFEKFYTEVRRTVKDKGVLAVIGYGLPRISPVIDQIIANFYYNTLDAYWDKERKYVDENYQTIPFPFKEVKAPAFENTLQWTFKHLTGFLGSGSAVQRYKKENGRDPVELIYEDLAKNWGEAASRPMIFPILLRVGRIEK